MATLIYELLCAHDGAEIRVARFEPAGSAVGVIQVIHGFGEGLVHYRNVADFFAREGYVCVIHDQRGFGEMPNKTEPQKKAARGVIPGYTYLLEDVSTVRDKIGDWYPGLPVSLFGHSMGGNIAINFLLKYEQGRYESAIIEAPWLRLYKPFPKFLTALGGLLGRMNKNWKVSAKLDMSDERGQSLKADGIFHDYMSFRLYAEVTRAGEYALEHAAGIRIPTLLLGAGADTIVSPAAIRLFAERAGGNVRFVEYPLGSHCLHGDEVNATALEDMLGFLKGVGVGA